MTASAPDADPDRIAALARQLAQAEKLARLGSWEWDVASNRVRWSDQLYEIYGLPRNRPIDLETFLNHVHADDRVATQEQIAGALSTGASFQFHHRIVRPDGSVRRLHARGESLIGDDGRAVGMRGTGQDVTEQYEAEQQSLRYAAEHAAREAAESAERRAAFLARASEVLASSLDYETTLRSVAKLAVPEIADWCGVDLVEDGQLRRLAVAHVDPEKVEIARELQRRYPSDPDAPRGVHNVIRTGSTELMVEIPDELIEAAAVDDEHLRILRELGLRSYVCTPLVARGRTLGALSVVYAESGRRYGPEMQLLIEDLGRRAGTAIDNALLVRQLEVAHERVQEQAAELEIQAEELQTQNELLETRTADLAAALRARGDFMATVSHELRTPLNAIMGYAQLIELGVSGSADSAVLEYVRRIGLSARHLLQLIDDILTFSALEGERETVSPDEVDVAALLDEVNAIIEPIAGRRGLEFHVAAERAPAFLHTDPRKLRQILLNLLGNAVKFTDRGSVSLTVERDGPDVRFEVADSGIGIPLAEQHRLFEPYWQSTEARTRRIGGAGLGLSISHRLAGLLGGELTAASSAGQGSVFTLRLPAGIGR